MIAAWWPATGRLDYRTRAVRRHGVQRALEAGQDERRAHKSTLHPLGVVVNRAKTRSAEQEYGLTELKDLFGPLVLSPVSLLDQLFDEFQKLGRLPHHLGGILI